MFRSECATRGAGRCWAAVIVSGTGAGATCREAPFAKRSPHRAGRFQAAFHPAAERSAAILLFQPRSSEARLSRPFLRQAEQCATRDSVQFTKRRSSTACTLDHSFGNVFPLFMATAIW